jgi:hypothetical protein
MEFESVSNCRNCKTPNLVDQINQGKFKETERCSISPVNSQEQNSYDSEWKPDSDGDDSDTASKILNSAATNEEEEVKNVNGNLKICGRFCGHYNYDETRWGFFPAETLLHENEATFNLTWKSPRAIACSQAINERQ